MKVLYIAHEYSLNGASKALLNLIDKYMDKHKVYVLTKFDNGPFWDELQKRDVKILCYDFVNSCERRNIYVRWLFWFVKWHLIDKRKNEQVAYKIANIIAEEKIDVIHSNTSVVDMGARLSKITGVTHIMHLREFGDKDFMFYPFVSRNKYYRSIEEYTKSFICISNAIYKHYDMLPTDKKVIIYDGIDLSENIERRDRDNHKDINILIVGRISKEKGQIQALEAFKILSEKDERYHLFLAGAGRIHIHDKYKNKVHILGYVKNMAELREKMDIELICSRSEAFGLVTVEAMRAGNIVIGSNTGATPEIISDGGTGLLYEYNNVHDLASKISEAIENDLLRNNCIENARKNLDVFSIDVCAENVNRLYCELVKE